MSIFKDLISLNIFIIALVVLYQTTDHHLALVIVITITALYIVKHFKLNNYIKKELKAHVEILETLFNCSTDVILYLDSNMNVIACNNTLAKTFAIPKEASIGHNVFQLLDKNVKDKTRRQKIKKNVEFNIQRAIKTGKSVQFSEKFYIKNEDVEYFNILVFPAFSLNKDSKGVIFVARNVTTQQNAIKEAQEKEKLLKCLLENMPVYGFMKDRNDNFIIGSSMFENIARQVNNRDKQLLLSDIFDKKYRDFVKEEEKEVYATKKTIEVERQVTVLDKTFLARIRKAPVIGEDGEVKYMIVMCENIEAEKEMTRQKEYFIETLIHDLKIPTLAQLRGLELLYNESIGELSTEQKDLIDQIGASCKYILEMIAMVLNTYRIENGQNNLFYEKFSVAELLLECFEEVTPHCEEKNLKFVYAATDSDTNVEADREDIKKVITNLLHNAITYSNKNEEIIVKIVNNNNQIKFIIISRGISLSDEECSTMFTRSGTATPKYNTIGNGISLYLCKKIIDLHQGKICAYTDGDNTNTFTFILPKCKQEMPTCNLNHPLFI